jgi:thioredoxin reductase (NADPH)
MVNASSLTDAVAFPKLTAADMAQLKPMATACSFRDGETVFRAGDPEIDLFVVESGEVAILNPADGDLIVTHGPGQFSGDIDLLTRRPVLVTGVARGETQLLRIPGARIREVLNKLPHFAEIMLLAIQERRRLLAEMNMFGLKVVGPGKCRDTTLVREFLYKNFVPFVWYDSASSKGQQLMAAWGSPQKSPVIEFTDGRRLINPGLRELAQNAGVWRHCPPGPVDLAILGGGPAGMAAAVYAASEGECILEDRKLYGFSKRALRSRTGNAQHTSNAQVRSADGGAGGR